MTLSLTIIQIALIFLPGIIWSTMDARFGAMRERSQFQITLKAFLFGVISYALTFVIYATLGVPFGIVDDVRLDQGLAGLRDLTDEILVAVVIAFTSSILWLYGTNYKLFGRFLQHIKATKRFGDEDVWDYVFNSSSPMNQYINLRDFDKRIVYAGYPQVFSESEKMRELVLRDVEVYDFDGNLLYRMPHIYVARQPDDIHLEFPYDPSANRAGGR